MGSWDLLPEAVQILMLAQLQVQDLIPLPRVCRRWRDIIGSPHFCKLQLLLCKPQDCVLTLTQPDTSVEDILPRTRHYCSKRLNFVTLSFPCGGIWGVDGGLVLRINGITDKTSGKVSNFVEVGNPLTNSWKTLVSPPSDWFFNDKISGMEPAGIVVDKLSNTYMILAACPVGCTVVTEVFESRQNLWRKGATLHWDGILHNELVGSILLRNRKENRIASYDFEQDNWSVVNLGHLNVSYPFELTLFQCNGEMILVSYAHEVPIIAIWKGNICNGMLQWALITQLEGESLLMLLRDHGLTTTDVITSYFSPPGMEAIFHKGETIICSLCARGTGWLFLLYDPKRCSWGVEVAPREHPSFIYFVPFLPSLVSP